MKEKKDFYQVIQEIYKKDTRYKPDAYEFVMQALYFTQKKMKKGLIILDGCHITYLTPPKMILYGGNNVKNMYGSMWTN